MTRWQWLAAAGLGTALYLPTLARAESARMESLGGHRLFEDPSDIFVFPGLLSAHADRLYFTYRPLAANGGGGMTFGRGRVVGLHANRGAVEHVPRTVVTASRVVPSDYEAFVETLASGGLGGLGVGLSPPPALMADVLFGLPSGLGFRLSVANSVDDTIETPNAATGGEGEGEGGPAEGEGEGEGEGPAPDVGGDGGGPSETGTQFTVVEVGAGWSQRLPHRSVDVGGALSFNQVKTVVANDIVLESTGTPSLSAAGRVALRMSPRYELGILAAADLRNWNFDLPKAKGSVERGLLSLVVGVGPRMALSEKVTLAATVVAGLVSDSGKVRIGEGKATEVSETRFVLPGFDLALEAQVKDWLWMRTGFYSRYRFGSSETIAPDLTTERSWTQQEFDFSAGLGVRFSGFELDGALTVPFLTAGPDFVSGASPGLFSTVTLAYRWGGDEEPVPAAAPAPEGGDPAYVPETPPYEPAPAAPPPYEEPPRRPYWR